MVAEISFDEIHKLIEDGELEFELDRVDASLESSLDVVYYGWLALSVCNRIVE